MSKPSLWEMVSHPIATLNKIQGLNRLPDRRVSKHRRGGYGSPGQEPDPLRRDSRMTALAKALGVYALMESRVELYENYREMDSDPMIAAVLDAFAEDAAQKDAEHKRIVWIESPNEDIRRIGTETLDRTRVDQWAFPAMRAMGRDGDVFMHVAAARGVGVVALRPYEPWTVARIEDDIGRLTGFAPANESGLPGNIERSSVPHYRVLHFRLPPRELTDRYGAASSFLWGSRIVWRELQLMEDQVVMQRLLRRPDRILILMDTMGLSFDDAWQQAKDLEKKLYREQYVNPQQGIFSSFGTPLDSAKDVVFPLGHDNQSKVQNFPATNTNDLLRDVDLFLARLAAGIGFPVGFLGRGDMNTYKPGESLSRQSQPFAKRAARLQNTFLSEIARMLMIDFAMKGLDPLHPHNSFTVNMATVSPIQELEHNEIIQLKTDRMERALAFGQNAKLDLSIWIPFVLEKYGGLSRELIKRVYKGEVPSSPVASPNPVTDPITYTAVNEKEAQKLEEAVKRCHEEVGDTIPEVDGVERFRSVELVQTIADGDSPWRPTHINESTGKGVVIGHGLMEAAEPFAKTTAQLVTEQFLEKRRQSAQTRVQLLTGLAGLIDAGKL
jgi:Bacteriophage T4-like portal protein (Gp20)